VTAVHSFLTTQLYFRAKRKTQGTSVRPELVIAVEAGSSGKDGRYHFVLDKP
jgi:hypothetical protein